MSAACQMHFIYKNSRRGSLIKYTDTGVRGKGLWIFNNGNMMSYYQGKILLYDSEFRLIGYKKLPMGAARFIASHNRYTERLLHCEPRYAVGVSETEVLLQMGKNIFNYNILDDALKMEGLCMDSRSLSAHKICNVRGFMDSVVLGDYGGNPERRTVNIYQRSLHKDDWKIIYTFDKGTIRHIHGFFSRENDDCVYILTGDEDSESGIWRAENNFAKVEELFVGRQQYRTCQMFSLTEGIYYCTDAPSERNYIYKLKDGKPEILTRIRGTCIYGVKTPFGFLGSTTCEADVAPGHSLRKMLIRKPGKGIDGRNVDLFFVNQDSKVEILANYKHDGLPLRLMQYGTVVFSNYCNGKVLCTPISVKKNDFHCFLLSLNGE